MERPTDIIFVRCFVQEEMQVDHFKSKAKHHAQKIDLTTVVRDCK